MVDLFGSGVEGTLRASELSRERIEDARSMLKEGEDIGQVHRRRSQEPDHFDDQGQGYGRGSGSAAGLQP